MAEINMHEIVKKLVGPINPIGESHVDTPRLENLKEMTDLVSKLLYDIHCVRRENKLSSEHSRAHAAEVADKFLKNHNNGIG